MESFAKLTSVCILTHPLPPPCLSLVQASMMQAIDRYMKQAIVDRAPGVSSAALVSCRHIMKESPEVVKRWVSEVQEALMSDWWVVRGWLRVWGL